MKNQLVKTTLKELEVGDIFVHASSVSLKGKANEFLVIGSPMFNARHGRATRKCIDLKSKTEVGKSAPMEVFKIRESVHKSALIKKYSPNATNNIS